MNRMSNFNFAAAFGTLMIAITLWLSCSQAAFGYGVLTHQATVDAVWNDTFQPLLRQRFPNASDKELREARAFAYGGSIIQDMGYFNFSSKFFSDLVHYVRSGDFVEALTEEACDINEYAFALGALAHYVGDNHGHAMAVNRAIPVLYPELHANHGHEVTFADDPTAHVQTEFAFDVWQVAHDCYAPQSFHNAIGFKVSKSVLERAFSKTYGLEMKEIFLSVDMAIVAYRRAISQVIPRITRVALELKKKEIRARIVNSTCQLAIDDQEWGEAREQPGLLDKTVALVLRAVPRVGKLKALAFKLPSSETAAWFASSFNTTLADYRKLLQQARHGLLALVNNDFDTGRLARAGEYKLADAAYAKLLDKLASNGVRQAAPGLREDILAFYGSAGELIAKNLLTKEPPQTRALLSLE